MKLGLGIDTGGTYTDAVLYDFESGQVMAGAKSLTTKEELFLGICGALDKLPEELLSKVQLVSLSTTLATNACIAVSYTHLMKTSICPVFSSYPSLGLNNSRMQNAILVFT